MEAAGGAAAVATPVGAPVISRRQLPLHAAIPEGSAAQHNQRAKNLVEQLDLDVSSTARKSAMCQVPWVPFADTRDLVDAVTEALVSHIEAGMDGQDATEEHEEAVLSPELAEAVAAAALFDERHDGSSAAGVAKAAEPAVMPPFPAPSGPAAPPEIVGGRESGESKLRRTSIASTISQDSTESSSCDGGAPYPYHPAAPAAPVAPAAPSSEISDGSFVRGRWRRDVRAFLVSVLDALSLDPECLVVGLILLERLVLAEPSPRLVLQPHTWRLTALVALLVAAKTWYDQSVFSADFCDHLRLCTRKRINALELHFLSLLEYATAVSTGLYIRYCFALQDVVAPLPAELSAEHRPTDAERARANADVGPYQPQLPHPDPAATAGDQAAACAAPPSPSRRANHRRTHSWQV